MPVQTMTSTASPLTPAPVEKIREAVVKMFAAYPAHGSAEMAESAIGTYVATLSEYPLRSIVEAAQAFLSGRVSGYNPAFRPSAAQWAVEARKRRDEARAAQMPAKALPAPDKPISAEERAKVAALFEGLAKRLGGDDRREATLTEDDALEMLRAEPIRVSTALIEKINTKAEMAA